MTRRTQRRARETRARIYYHRTTATAALAILRSGFRNGRGTYMTGTEHEGVWISAEVLDIHEGAHGPVIFAMHAPVAAIERFEWIEKGKPYREFLVPADVLNRRARITRISIETDYTVDRIKRLAKKRGVQVKMLP